MAGVEVVTSREMEEYMEAAEGGLHVYYLQHSASIERRKLREGQYPE
jgi:hypothetical protein